jgi:predicted GNAT family N-acyltransferase
LTKEKYRNKIKTLIFYGEKIYTNLGFTKIDEAQEKDGITYIPMEYKIQWSMPY